MHPPSMQPLKELSKRRLATKMRWKPLNELSKRRCCRGCCVACKRSTANLNRNAISRRGLILFTAQKVSLEMMT